MTPSSKYLQSQNDNQVLLTNMSKSSTWIKIGEKVNKTRRG